jgi:hypothetical protein
MVWLYPAAVASLLALVGPVAVHMLRRQQARRIIVPSVRFVPSLDDSAVRFKRLSDPLLLLVRSAVIACAALALAQPLILSEGRMNAWSARTARVVVVDRSQSARGAVSSEAIAAEASSADPSATVETAELGSGLDQASAWLAVAPPARREIVVLSDFQLGSLTEREVGRVPAEIGLRFVRMSKPGPIRREAPLVQLLAPGGVVHGRADLQNESTAMSYTPVRDAANGLQILAAEADAGAVASLLRVVAAAGARAPSAAQPIIVRFTGADSLGSPSATAEPWTFGAAQRLLRSPLVAGIVIQVSTSGGALVVDVNADPRSLAAAQAVKAALDARPDPRELAEAEPERISEATLTVWSRAPGPPDTAAWRHSDEADGRWLWGAALLLLGVETLVRRSVPRDRRRVTAHAA